MDATPYVDFKERRIVCVIINNKRSIKMSTSSSFILGKDDENVFK
jgi:hypothetical protein